MSNYSSICLLAKDENEYINEWLNWHINVCKFDHIYIYDNESKIPLINSINKEYLNYCTFINWNSDMYKDNMQVECYHHFIFNYRKDNYWTAFIDADEFIRINDGRCINDFLKEYEDYNGIYVLWLMYNANGQIKKENGLVRERFTEYKMCDRKLSNGKCIIKPNEFRFMGAHFPFVRRNFSHNYRIVYSNKERCDPYDDHTKGPIDTIVVDHYFTKSYEEWKEKLKRGSCDPNYIREYDEFFEYNPEMKDKIIIGE